MKCSLGVGGGRGRVKMSRSNFLSRKFGNIFSSILNTIIIEKTKQRF